MKFARVLLFASLFIVSLAKADFGLPSNPNSHDLYRLNMTTHVFQFVPASETQEAQLYVRYSPDRNRWIWCSGKDRRMIWEDSKVQGWRFGFSTAQPEHRGLNWFRLAPDFSDWKKATDRIRPNVYREDEFGRKVLVERYPDSWVNWGGDLDPIDAKPTCDIVTSKAKVNVGEKFTVEIQGKGTITKATFAGNVVLLPSSQTVMAGPEGKQKFEAYVEGPAGSSFCQAEVVVGNAVTAGPVSCELSVDKNLVMVDEAVRFKLTSSGDVRSATLDGASIEPNATRNINFVSAGEKEIRAVVYGADSSATCTAKVNVQKLGVVGETITCHLTITPKIVKLGDNIVFSLITEGPVQKAELDGNAIGLPYSNVKIKTERADSFNPTVKIFGPGGVTESCHNSYEVIAN